MAALEAAVTDETAAVVLEPIQGEAGVVVPPDRLPRGRRPDRPRRTAPCSGSTRCRPASGRTGRWFAHHDAALHGAVVPDVVTVAKGLGGGIPIGACIGVGDAGHLLQPGNHGTTFGGNPVAAAAALAVLGHDRGGGPARPRHEAGGAAPARASPSRASTEVRGAGLLVGLDLDAPTARGQATSRDGRRRPRLHRQRLHARPDPARAAAGAHREPRPTSSWPRGR